MSWLAERGAPDDVPRVCDQSTHGQDHSRCHDNQGEPTPWCSPIQWLCVDMPLHTAVEVLNAVDRTCGLPVEDGDDVIAYAISIIVVERNRCVSGCGAQSR